MDKIPSDPSHQQTVGDLGEDQLITRLTTILGKWGNEWISGPDDAVAFLAPQNSQHVVVWKTDMLVGTTDVPEQMTMIQAGRKCVVMNCSDLFVKGVIPQYAVIAIGLPRQTPLEGERGFDGLIQGLRDGCDEFQVQYLGGDLGETKELIVSMTVAGEGDPQQLIRRNGAKAGDLLYTTGEYGLTGIGLQLTLHPEDSAWDLDFDKKTCLDAVFYPNFNIKIGPVLAEHGWAHAGADSSDGLLKTVEEICLASQVGITLDWDRIPIASAVQQYQVTAQTSIESLVLATGEEFTHLFAVDPVTKQMLKIPFDQT